MKGKILKTLVLVGILTLAAGAGQAWAQTTAQGTLTVTATVGRHCAVESPTLAFGDYNPFNTTAVEASVDFLVRCTRHATADPSVQLGGGLNYSSGRRMAGGGSEYLAYSLYSDAGRTSTWDTTNAVIIPSPTLEGTTLTVYGRIPAGQDAAADTYSDSVTIIVNF